MKGKKWEGFRSNNKAEAEDMKNYIEEKYINGHALANGLTDGSYGWTVTKVEGGKVFIEKNGEKRDTPIYIFIALNPKG